MQDTRYGLKVSVNLPYEQAAEKATTALKAQGFGVLTTIDVKETLKAKLDRNFRLMSDDGNPPASWCSGQPRHGRHLIAEPAPRSYCLCACT